jgi:hypothetical protein
VKAPWDAIVWWEKRRLLFNLVLGVLGLGTLIVVALVESTFARPGEDFIESALIFVGPVLFGVAANLAYCLGWITELLWSGGDTAVTAPRRERIFWLGVLGSSLVTLAPAGLMIVIWVLAQISGPLSGKH